MKKFTGVMLTLCFLLSAVSCAAPEYSAEAFGVPFVASIPGTWAVTTNGPAESWQKIDFEAGESRLFLHDGSEEYRFLYLGGEDGYASFRVRCPMLFPAGARLSIMAIEVPCTVSDIVAYNRKRNEELYRISCPIETATLENCFQAGDIVYLVIPSNTQRILIEGDYYGAELPEKDDRCGRFSMEFDDPGLLSGKTEFGVWTWYMDNTRAYAPYVIERVDVTVTAWKDD